MLQLHSPQGDKTALPIINWQILILIASDTHSERVCVKGEARIQKSFQFTGELSER